MGFELTDEQQALRDLVRDFAEAEIDPARRRLGPHPHLPRRPRPEARRPRALRAHRPRAVRRRRRRLHLPLHRRRRARPRRPVHRHHAVGRRRPRHQPDPHLRHRRAARPLAARPGRRTRARRVRTHRAGRRHRRRRHPHPRRAARRRVGDQRQPRRSSPTPAPPITSCITITARTGARDDGRPEISTMIVPAGTPGLTVEPAYDKLGWHASDTHGLTFDDCRVPEDALLGPRGDGLRQMLGILDDGRIAIAALSVGLIAALPRRVRRLRRDAHDVRPADRLAPGRRVPDQRPRRRPRGSAPADLPGGVAQGRRTRTRRGVEGRGHRQALRHRGRGAARPAPRRRCSAATASWRSRRWRGSTATRRSWRSARARPRCSAW